MLEIFVIATRFIIVIIYAKTKFIFLFKSNFILAKYITKKY